MNRLFSKKIKVFPSKYKLHYWQVTKYNDTYKVNPKPYTYTLFEDHPTLPIKYKNHATTLLLPTIIAQHFIDWKEAYLKQSSQQEKGIAVTYDSSDYILIHADITNNFLTPFSHPELIRETYKTIGEEIRKVTPDKFMTLPTITDEWYKEQLFHFYAEPR